MAKLRAGWATPLLIITGIVAMALTLGFLQSICRFFGSTDVVLPYATEYGSIIAIGFPFFVLGIGANSFTRANGNPRRAMLAMLVGAITNVILDPIFIFIFHWGVVGAAWATVIGQGFASRISITYLPKCKHISITKKLFLLQPKTMRTSCSYGMSSFITQIAITLGIFMLNNSIVTYGAMSVYGSGIPLASFGIVMKVNQVLTSIVMGIAVGTQPILGFNYGAHQYGRVRKTYGIAIGCSLVITAIGLFVFQVSPQSIVNLFGEESQLYNEFALMCFRIFLMLCILNGFQMTTGIFFQAIGKPLKATLITMSRQLIGLIPALLILPRFLGIYGVLWSAPVADAAAFTIAFVFVILEFKKMPKTAPFAQNIPNEIPADENV